MKSIKKYLFIPVIFLIGICMVSSCKKNPLDRPLELDVQDSTIFKNISYTTEYVTDIYGGVISGYTALGGFTGNNGTMYEAATDDAVHANLSNDSYRYTNGTWGPTFNPDDIYGNSYRGIRKCNVFFENIGKVQVKDHGRDLVINNITATVQRDRLIGEVFFLRAYYYFDMLKRYGGVPITLQSLSLQDDINLPRKTFDEVVKRVVLDCDSAFKRLPDTYIGSATENYYGKGTKWSAAALKARTLLYAASPLNNPGNDLSKWTLAAEAAKPFNDGTTSAMFNLAPGITGYEGLFKTNTSTNKEIIWSRVATNSNTLESANFPVGEVNGNGGVCPSQYLVDAYEMKDGLPYTTSPLYSAANPYANRDPRFAVSIFYNGSPIKARTIETFDGGLDGAQKSNGTRTGYYMRKHIDPAIDLGAATPGTTQRNWIHFRLAEMILNYAEAVNEAQGPTNEVYTAMNLIRNRVTMPVLPTGLTQVEMRERIRNERRIELSFEGHRYWDARRWNIAKDVFNRKMRGMKILKAGSTFTYTPYDMEQKVFTENMNRYPFLFFDLQSNPKLVQNPGW